MDGGVRSDSYRQAGVDIDLAHSLLDRVKEEVRTATRPEVLAPIGGFGGLFQLDLSRWKKPVMVTSVDGVGTKLMVAGMAGKHDTVGADIVNHCIDDVIVQGAEPLYFLDYLGIGKLRSPLYEQVLVGIARACREQNVALLGGETAEMPGMYGDDYDLVGCITGVAERDRLITGETVRAGHVAVGLASNGLHTNGYSLARRVLFEVSGLSVHTYLAELGSTVGEALLRPHTCYWPAVRAAQEADLPLGGIAHITGGGLYDNVPRVLPDEVGVVFDRRDLPVTPVFSVIQERGGIGDGEMYRVFNMGLGMVWFVPPERAADAVRCAEGQGCNAAVIGEVVESAIRVAIRGVDC